MAALPICSPLAICRRDTVVFDLQIFSIRSAVRGTSPVKMMPGEYAGRSQLLTSAAFLPCRISEKLLHFVLSQLRILGADNMRANRIKVRAR
jgi:hypothetical protein